MHNNPRNCTVTAFKQNGLRWTIFFRALSYTQVFLVETTSESIETLQEIFTQLNNHHTDRMHKLMRRMNWWDAWTYQMHKLLKIHKLMGGIDDQMHKLISSNWQCFKLTSLTTKQHVVIGKRSVRILHFKFSFTNFHFTAVIYLASIKIITSSCFSII